MKSWPTMSETGGQVWAVTIEVEGDFTLTFPLDYFGPVDDITVYWGDGQLDTFRSNFIYGVQHRYEIGGRYTIVVMGPPLYQWGDIGNLTPYIIRLDTPVPAERGISCYDGFFGPNITSVKPSLLDHVKYKQLDPDGLFAGCTSLESVPESIFDNIIIWGSSADRMFRRCRSLLSIWDMFTLAFANCQSVSGCFASCSKISTIPDGLFRNMPDLHSAGGCFSGCTSIKNIPEDLFSGCPRLGNVGNCFSSMTSLKEIPENLFLHNPLVYDFYGCFSGDTGLTSIPETLFDSLIIQTDELDFGECFYGCEGITGPVPELWNKFPNARHFWCFRGCTNAANYADIPGDWK